MTILIILFGKLISFISKIFNIGSGGTWPGEIALRINPKILKDFSSQLHKGSILVVGTNGKTTTTLMIKTVLEYEGLKVIHNESGANLLNGIVSIFIQNSSWMGKIDADYGVFEIDENSLPAVISNFSFDFAQDKQLIIVFLNLFRDQLDRYGEVDVIAEKWGKALKRLPKETKLILNADDPLIAHLGKSVSSTPGVEARFFGLDDPKLFLKEKEHATDSIFCLNCGARLIFDGIYYSHLGIWRCSKCHEKRPKLDIDKWILSLPGVYNQYNTLAAVGAAKALGIANSQIQKALSSFSPAFGRQEELIVGGKKVKIFLSKNPAGFNESLRTVIAQGAKEILFVLNDRIPDGRDVSWIWDVDFEMLPGNIIPVVSGDRAFDLAIRIKYAKANPSVLVYEDLNKALEFCLGSSNKKETLFVMATYSAMLEVRKILKGRKIL